MLLPDPQDATRENAETNRVYDSIKALVIRHALPPGRRILVEPLADELNVSNTPVREVLIQLASERLIREVPKAGFFTKEISELEIRNLYIFNRTILESSLGFVRTSGQVPGMLKPPRLLDDTGAFPAAAPENIVQTLNALFVHIARQSGNMEFICGVRNINDRTYFIRLHECELLDGWREDLRRLCRLYHQKNIAALRRSITAYHDKVIGFLPELLLLLRRAQADIRY